jgi:hypothetical protein
MERLILTTEEGYTTDKEEILVEAGRINVTLSKYSAVVIRFHDDTVDSDDTTPIVIQ